MESQLSGFYQQYPTVSLTAQPPSAQPLLPQPQQQTTMVPEGYLPQPQFTGAPQQQQPAMQQPTIAYATAPQQQQQQQPLLYPQQQPLLYPQQQPLLYPQQQPAMQYMLAPEQPQATLNQPQYVSHLAPAGVVQAGQLQQPQQVMMAVPSDQSFVPQHVPFNEQQRQSIAMNRAILALLEQQQQEQQEYMKYRKPFVGGTLETQKKWERATLCCFFLQGECKFGIRCRFSHKDDPGKMCQFGEKCKSGHANRQSVVQQQTAETGEAQCEEKRETEGTEE